VCFLQQHCFTALLQLATMAPKRKLLIRMSSDLSESEPRPKSKAKAKPKAKSTATRAAGKGKSKAKAKAQSCTKVTQSNTSEL
jgi:hypothetical protein